MKAQHTRPVSRITRLGCIAGLTCTDVVTSISTARLRPPWGWAAIKHLRRGYV